MNILLRALLFLFAAGALFFVLKKVRNSQAQIESAVFWVLFMLGLVIISIFPGIVIYVSGLIGIESPANFVYLCIIFILLLRVFNLSLQLSKFQYQIQQLAQIIALEKSQRNMEELLPNEGE
jgi:hypothetical protein